MRIRIRILDPDPNHGSGSDRDTKETKGTARKLQERQGNRQPGIQGKLEKPGKQGKGGETREPLGISA